ncbi:MAG: hypothetical protein KAY21_09310 [Limnohabitans sp.]|nr:hypothetical protein [Limnohabitans sp.]
MTDMNTPAHARHEAVVRGPTSSREKTARSWPAEGYTRAPYWVYTDPDIYAQEQVKIFRGKTWNYLGLEAEVPEVGSFTTAAVNS